MDKRKSIPEDIEQRLIAVEWIDTHDLIIDPTYQRGPGEAQIRQMAANWDWNACANLAVSLRTDEQGHSYYAVIDGQRRLGAIILQGFEKAPCRIYIDLTPKQEAHLFDLLNAFKKPTSNDMFRSRLAQNDPEACIIKAAVEAGGFQLDLDRQHQSGWAARQGTDWRWLASTLELERIYSLGGEALILASLSVITELWANMPGANKQSILGGVAAFLHRYPEIERREMIRKLAGSTPAALEADALQWKSLMKTSFGTGSNSSPIAISEVLLIRYNRGRTTNRVQSRI